MSQFTHYYIIPLAISSKSRLGKQILLKIHRFRALTRDGCHAPEPELSYKQMNSVPGPFLVTLNWTKYSIPISSQMD